jgi:hypothetical protein
MIYPAVYKLLGDRMSVVLIKTLKEYGEINDFDVAILEF